MNLFQDFIQQTSSADVHNSSISEFNSSSNRDDEGDADMSIADRYYTKDEYYKLSNSEKLGLKQKRSSRGHKRYGNPNPNSRKRAKSNGGQQQRTNAKLSINNRSIAALASKLAKTIFNDNDEANDLPTEAPMPVDMNRTNKALK